MTILVICLSLIKTKQETTALPSILLFFPSLRRRVNEFSKLYLVSFKNCHSHGKRRGSYYAYKNFFFFKFIFLIF